MFTLWYTVLSWREYRRLNSQKTNTHIPKKEISKIPVAEPLKPSVPKGTTAPDKPQAPTTPVVQQPTPPIKLSQTITEPPTPSVVKPASPKPQPVKPIIPAPSKIPRAPSPHVNTEAFDDLDFEEDDESDGEEDDEDSVVGSPWRPNPALSRISPTPKKTTPINEFLNQERGQPKLQGLPGSTTQNSRIPPGISKQEDGDKKPM